jgi:hypothetical protein
MILSPPVLVPFLISKKAIKLVIFGNRWRFGSYCKKTVLFENIKKFDVQK